MTQALPTVSGSNNVWGTELNGWLLVSHNADGTLATAAALPTLTGDVVVSASGALSVNTASEVNATSGNLTMTLPTSVTGALIVVEKTDSTSNSVTITGNLRNVSSSSMVIKLQYESVMFFGYSGSWWPVAGHKTLASLQATFLQLADNLSDLPNVSAARASLGLGSAALQSTTAFDPAGAASTAQSTAEAFATSAVASYLPLTGGALTGPLTITGSFTTNPVNLTDGATIAVNAATSDVFRVTLGGNRTLANPSNATDGQTITLEIVQDSAGSRTLAYGASYFFPASIGTPVLSSTPGYRDFLAFRYNAVAGYWFCVGFVPQASATSGGAVPVTQGGTGDTVMTAYAVLAGGTSTTGALQQVSGTGTTGQVLTSNGTGLLPTWQASASGFSNPMTTVGDLIFENSTPAPARLAGSTSATKQFLTQTGTGSVSAAPAWGAIAAGDLPAATTSAQGAVILDATAADIAPTGSAGAAGAVGKAADAGHVHANALVVPGDFSFAAWTCDPMYCAATTGGSTSLMYLVKFFLRAVTTLNDVWLHVVTAPTGTLTSSENFAGVYDSGGTQRAVTADQSTAWGTSGVKEAAFASPYAAPAGWYYLVLNVNVSGGNAPLFRSATSATSAFLMNAGLSGSGLRVATQAAQATMPGSLTYTSNAQTTSGPICGVFV